jgi:hypothetical protein
MRASHAGRRQGLRRGRIWWIAYSRRGREYRESSRATDEKVARKMLQDRLSIPTRYSITVRDLARRPDLVRMLPDRHVQPLYSDCLVALDRLRARLSWLKTGTHNRMVTHWCHRRAMAEPTNRSWS